LLWSKNVHRFGIFTNEEIEFFVDKYLITNQNIFKTNIRNSQILQHKQTCRKKQKSICRFQYPKSPLNEKDNNSNIREIAFQIFKKLVDMKLGLEISFDQFLSDLHLNEHVYLLALQCTI
jgi:hypothetical protein